MNPFEPRNQLFALAVLLSLAIIAGVVYYLFFGKSANRIPTRGFFVEHITIQNQVS